ncbi:MAG: agmatinase [Thermosynechococcaceae cyanobacterium]
MFESDVLPPQQGFLGLSQADAVSFAEARAVIIPFGLEASVSYGGGTTRGPQAILDASPQLEFFDENLWCEPFRYIGFATLKEPVIETNIVSALAQLENLVAGVLGLGKFPLVLGGEHSITAGAIRPFAKAFPDLMILHFDAHADLRDGYGGEPFSHAAALRRTLDVSEQLQLISCGIRNISAEEIPYLEANQHRITIHWAKDKKRWDIDEIVAPLKGKPVYLTFDVDGFDASLMPATGTPEPGGLFWDDAIAIIEAAAQIADIVGADVNELAPMPGLHTCDFVAAKLVYRILSLAFLGKGDDLRSALGQSRSA